MQDLEQRILDLERQVRFLTREVRMRVRDPEAYKTKIKTISLPVKMWEQIEDAARDERIGFGIRTDLDGSNPIHHCELLSHLIIETVNKVINTEIEPITPDETFETREYDLYIDAIEKLASVAQYLKVSENDYIHQMCELYLKKGR